MKKLLTFYFIFGFFYIAFAQNPFNVDFDARRFSESDSTGRIEIYYSFYHTNMKFKVSNGDTLLNGLLNVKISSESKDQIFLNKKYSFEQVLNPSNNTTIGILKYPLLKGIYRCELKGQDLNQEAASDSVSFVFSITGFDEKRFSISGLQFASSLIKSDFKNSPFYKNNYEVVPNPSGIYGEASPVLYFYSELYNLNRGTISPILNLDYAIYNQYEEIVFYKKKAVESKNTAIVFAEAVNVSKLPTGSYKLVLSISDTLAKLSAQNSKRFTIINSKVKDSQKSLINADVISSEFAKMDAEQISDVFSFSRYLATKREVDVWNSLATENEKRNFLFHFWKRRDPDPATPNNKFKNDYFARVEIANKRFETMSKKGSKTDRGRVFCIFGEPDEIERYPNETNSNPYEIWNYYGIEGGVIFVFAEHYSFTDMDLIHSTKNGEVYEPSWREKIAR